MNQRCHMGQDDKVWSVLVMLLVHWTEKWWGSVMDVGLDPELTKWSVRSGPAIVLTGKGYKEHHWLAVSFINHFGYLHYHHLLSSCQCLLVQSLGPKISTAGVVPLSVSAVRLGLVPMPEGPLLPSCSMRKVTV